jgi:8-oxo-dGTP pyrophosphatase MutT (NUDIX family)
VRVRPSARLLFRFSLARGPLAGQTFWATPGGGLDPGETFEAAAIRELFEETGLHVGAVGLSVADRKVAVRMPDGEPVLSDERYFVVRTGGLVLSDARWTKLEREVMTEHRWWSIDELERAAEPVWPETLAQMLRGLSDQPV